MFTPFLIAVILGYFLGAIPFGFLVARAHGVNIFEVGSKSPGATNVKRVVGRGPGNLVFALNYHPAFDIPAIAAELRHWNQCHAQPLQHLPLFKA